MQYTSLRRGDNGAVLKTGYSWALIKADSVGILLY